MKNKKILILYAPVGMGHPMVARAIEEAFLLKKNEIEVKNVNVLDFTIKSFKFGLPHIYSHISSRIPQLYKWAYHYYEERSRQRFLHLSAQLFMKSKFIPYIQGFAPDFIISTHPLPMQLVSLTKQERIISIKSANVCTDYGCHSFWFNQDVNYYFAANEGVKKCLIGYGSSADKIKVTGIPVRQKFIAPLDREKIINQIKLSPKNPILLIVGGQLTYRELEKVVKKIKFYNNAIQFIIVGGRDHKLNENLEKSGLIKDQSIRVFGFVENMEELMSAADLIFSKAGGSTVAECLVKGLPMIVNKVIPGQEEDNVKYLIAKGAAVHAKKISNISSIIAELLADRPKLEKMKHACLQIGKPNAAQDLVNIVCDELNKQPLQ